MKIYDRSLVLCMPDDAVMVRLFVTINFSHHETATFQSDSSTPRERFEAKKLFSSARGRRRGAAKIGPKIALAMAKVSSLPFLVCYFSSSWNEGFTPPTSSSAKLKDFKTEKCAPSYDLLIFPLTNYFFPASSLPPLLSTSPPALPPFLCTYFATVNI